MLSLMAAISDAEAEHTGFCRNPLNGGGPAEIFEAMKGDGGFEFPATKPGGGREKSIEAM